MATLFGRMRDRHAGRAWYDSCASEAAAIEAVRDEARRILQPWSDTQPGVDIDKVHARHLSADDLRQHAKSPQTFAGCCGNCQQANRLCTVPEACGMPTEEPLTWRGLIDDTPMGVRIGAVCIGGVAAIAMALHIAARLGLLT